MKNKRGGARTGAGRPALPAEERLMHATVRLAPLHIRRLKWLGRGNISEGVRLLLESAVLDNGDGAYSLVALPPPPDEGDSPK